MKLDASFMEKLADSALGEGLADAVYGTGTSPIGSLLVVITDRGVCRIGFSEEQIDESLAEVAERVGPRILRSARHTSEVSERLEAYLEGASVDLDLPVDPALVRSAFQKDVLDALVEVERGSVTSYGALASAIGHPRAARAVGTALGRNPVPIVVPCHRVLPATGGVGGYGGGPARKRFLLSLEGVSPPLLIN
jgi:methylated-DNA-[protein]-cysteine S-methyltransferase